MANRLSDLTVEFVSLVDRAAVRDPHNPTEPQKFLLWKSESGGQEPTTEPIGGTMNPEELAAALAKAEQERDDALEAVNTAKAETEAATAKVTELEKAATPAEPEVEELDKSDLPEPVRKALAKAEAAEKVAKAERDAANDRIEKAENIAKEEREIRVTREFVAKADTFRALPIDSTVFGPILKAVSEKLSKDESDELDRVLQAADAQIAKGDLFKEHGRSGEPSGDTADQSITQKAQELRKSDSSLSEYDALDRAIRENPDLASAYASSVR